MNVRIVMNQNVSGLMDERMYQSAEKDKTEKPVHR